MNRTWLDQTSPGRAGGARRRGGAARTGRAAGCGNKPFLTQAFRAGNSAGAVSRGRGAEGSAAYPSVLPCRRRREQKKVPRQGVGAPCAVVTRRAGRTTPPIVLEAGREDPAGQTRLVATTGPVVVGAPAGKRGRLPLRERTL